MNTAAMNPTNAKKIMVPSAIHSTKEMWQNGPTREFSTERFPGCMPYGTQGYVGSYVCQSCEESVNGVYLKSGKWICGGCRADSGGYASRVRTRNLASV